MDGLGWHLEQLSELLQKQERYRMLYKYLQTNFEHHPNYCIWITAVEKMAAHNQRQIHLVTNGLNLGVFAA